MIRSDKIRASAKGQSCLYNSNLCNNDKSTTVLCHLDGLEWGKGIANKSHDLAAFFGCSTCHGVYAGTISSSLSKYDRDYLAYKAVIKTLIKLTEMGVIKVK